MEEGDRVILCLANPSWIYAQKYRAQIAAADQAFQAQFETLVRPNPRILEGSAQ